MIFHIDKSNNDYVTLCCINSTARYDLTANACSNVLDNEDTFNGDIVNMRRHRLLDILINDSQEVRVLINNKFVY